MDGWYRTNIKIKKSLFSRRGWLQNNISKNNARIPSSRNAVIMFCAVVVFDAVCPRRGGGKEQYPMVKMLLVSCFWNDPPSFMVLLPPSSSLLARPHVSLPCGVHLRPACLGSRGVLSFFCGPRSALTTPSPPAPPDKVWVSQKLAEDMCDDLYQAPNNNAARKRTRANSVPGALVRPPIDDVAAARVVLTKLGPQCRSICCAAVL